MPAAADHDANAMVGWLLGYIDHLEAKLANACAEIARSEEKIRHVEAKLAKGYAELVRSDEEIRRLGSELALMRELQRKNWSSEPIYVPALGEGAS